LTLVETLVVIAIVAVVVGLTVPAVQRVRDAGARLKCASNLRQLALAVHLFADVRQQLPKGCDYPFLRSPNQLLTQTGLSWQTSILPYVEQNALWRLAWEAHRQDPRGHAALHGVVKAKTVPVYLCPSEPRQMGGYGNGLEWGLTSYLGVAGTGVWKNDGVFHRNYAIRFADIPDGTSTTLMIGERPAGPKGIYGGWYAEWGSSVCQLAQILPAGSNDWIPFEGRGCRLSVRALRPGEFDNACDVNHFWSLHLGGAHFAFADGSVRFLTYARSEVLPALATRAGGESVNIE
jgi:prepilin-type processing-associated H-X9-DG protein